MLNPTPAEKLCDSQGRPYFLWDVDLTLPEWRQKVDDPDPVTRAYWIGATLRQAKPDDAIALLGPERIIDAWPLLRGRLGRSEAFWAWRIGRWNEE